MPRNNAPGPFHEDESGQTMIIVGLMVTVLLGFMGLVADVGWLQIGIVRAQRAADAAALAGAPYLPGNVGGATTAARNEATKNGFTHNVNGATVLVAQDPLNPNLLNVTVSATVRTFMSNLFGVPSFQTSRNARAEFILPVPMGSPQAYYGIYKLCVDGGTCSTINDPSGTAIPSQGFWGAVISYDGNRGNGDLYSTHNNGAGVTNAYYDANGYQYIVEFPTGTTNGLVRIFDAPYCATGKDNTGGQQQVDKGAAYGGNRAYGGTVNSGNYDSGSPKTYADCQSDPYHNAWWTINALAPINAGGQYRLQVKTSSPNNVGTNAENMFGIMATQTAPGLSTNPHVYGQSRMCDYVNVVAGDQLFYLAQIASVHAGKTLQITVHDPGDVGGSAYLKFEQPGSGGYS